MNSIVEVSAMIKKYIASRENNSYENNNTELWEATMVNIHI